MECLLNNDPEGIVELSAIYLDEYNKVGFLKEAPVSRSTAYQVLRHKNPTIKTLAKIVSTAAAHYKIFYQPSVELARIKPVSK